jgi:hypothetical protein
MQKRLPVEQSNTMPWFGQQGMGVQFDTSTQYCGRCHAGHCGGSLAVHVACQDGHYRDQEMRGMMRKLVQLDDDGWCVEIDLVKLRRVASEFKAWLFTVDPGQDPFGFLKQDPRWLRRP